MRLRGHSDLWPPNSNQVIHESKWIVADVMKFPVGSPDISPLQEHEVTVTLTFDLQAPKSRSFECKWNVCAKSERIPTSQF